MSQELSSAKNEYSSASAAVKEVLERIFGKDAFAYDWRSIKTFEDACRVNGTIEMEILPYEKPVTGRQEWLNALAKMDQIVKAINPDFKPDYSNSSQYKWFPWFKYEPKISGFRFFDSLYVYVITLSSSGSRLCSESEEKAKYIGEQFIDIWNVILLK